MESDKDLLKEKIAREQMGMIYSHLPGAIIPPVFAAIVIAVLMHDQTSTFRAWGWVTWVAVFYFALPLLWFLWYKKTSAAQPDSSIWGHRYIVLTVLTTASWGASGVLLYVPGEIFYQVFLAGMIFTAAAAVMVATVPYTPGYFAGVLPLMLPITTMFLLEGQLVQYMFSGMLFFAFAMLTFFHRNMHKSMSETIALRFDRERLVNELEEKNDLINKAIQNKSQFLAAASHDLRQPIHAQQLFLSELNARIKDDDTLQIISQMKHSMESMDLLLDELLAVSKLDSGVIEVKHSTFSLETVLHRIEEQFRNSVMKKQLRFRISRCSHTVYSDPVMLERILRNYVQNAIRYTERGAVLVICRCKRNKLEIQIRDSGPGISLEDQGRIFKGFVQLDNTSKRSGNGLGLAIVKRLSILLDHEVGVRSSIGKGATFYVRVPLSNSEQSATQNIHHETKALANVRILVVDDDQSILKAMGLLLDRWNCDYVLAPDLEQSLSSINEDGFIPQILIADYHLQNEVDGIELIAQVRSQTSSQLPAVLITSDMTGDIVRIAKSQNCILMYKPVDSVSLYNLLCNLYLMHADNKLSLA